MFRGFDRSQFRMVFATLILLILPGCLWAQTGNGLRPSSPFYAPGWEISAAGGNLTPVDLNEDGMMDYVTSESLNSIVVYVATLIHLDQIEFEKFTFVHSYGIGHFFQTCDLDGDGDIDVLLWPPVNLPNVTVLWNRFRESGTVEFEIEQLFIDLEENSGYCKCIDIDGDGDGDVITRNGYRLNDFSTDGGIAFSPLNRVENQLFHNVAFGDINSDGLVDIVGATGKALNILISDLASTFTLVQTLHYNDIDACIRQIVDIDGDGSMEIWSCFGILYKSVLDETSVLYDIESRVGFGLLDIDESWREQDFDVSARFRDFDGDGFREYVRTHPFRLFDVFDDEGMIFDELPILEQYRMLSTPSAVDVDGDGDLDLVGLHEGLFYGYLNLGGVQGGEPLTFQAPLFGNTRKVGPVASVFYQPFPLDYDGDGLTDLLFWALGGLAVAHRESPRLQHFQGVQSLLHNIFAPTEPILADFDLDGDLDIFMQGAYEHSFYIYEWEYDPADPSNIIRTPPHQHFVGMFVRGMTVGDIDGDGDPDVLIDDTSNKVWVSWNMGGKQNGTVGEYAPLELLIDQSVGAIGSKLFDLDGDGDLDLMRNRNGFLNNGGLQGGVEGTFTKEISYDEGGLQRAIFPADYNNDGRMDFATLEDEGDQKFRIFYNDGFDEFWNLNYTTKLVTLDEPTEIVYPVDVDGDGDVDLVIIGYDFIVTFTNLGGVQGREPGTFSPTRRIRRLPGTYGGYEAVVDLDNDLDPDIVVCDSTNVFIHENRTYGLKSAEVTAANTVEVEFEVAVDDRATSPSSYSISGGGAWNLPEHPATVEQLTERRYRLHWTEGSMVSGGAITITASGRIKDKMGNHIGFRLTATDPNGAIGDGMVSDSWMLLDHPEPNPRDDAAPRRRRGAGGADRGLPLAPRPLPPAGGPDESEGDRPQDLRKKSTPHQPGVGSILFGETD